MASVFAWFDIGDFAVGQSAVCPSKGFVPIISFVIVMAFSRPPLARRFLATKLLSPGWRSRLSRLPHSSPSSPLESTTNMARMRAVRHTFMSVIRSKWCLLERGDGARPTSRFARGASYPSHFSHPCHEAPWRLSNGFCAPHVQLDNVAYYDHGHQRLVGRHSCAHEHQHRGAARIVYISAIIDASSIGGRPQLHDTMVVRRDSPHMFARL